MNDIVFDKKKTVKYLIWTFALAWAVQIGVWQIAQNGNAVAARLVMAAMMFIPALAVLLAGGSLRGMGWKPNIGKYVPLFLASWFGPLVLAVIGGALYFLLFPGHLDLSGQALVDAAGTPEVLEQMEAQGLTYPLYLVISAISCVSYAPLINTFVALGEEIGWRGFLYPQLKARFGRRGGWLLGGVIWGAWHWPLIWLIGYEYGADYFGYPVVGMLLFCVFTVALGILADWVYEKTECIWFPALLHGAVNAAAGLPLMMCRTDTGSAILLGPVFNGLLAGLPMIALAAVLLAREKKTAEK